jgi:hypothetical protein
VIVVKHEIAHFHELSKVGHGLGLLVNENDHWRYVRLEEKASVLMSRLDIKRDWNFIS